MAAWLDDDDPDDLDREIVAHFAARFPRPARLADRVHAFRWRHQLAGLVVDQRHGDDGDWRDFPCIAGDVLALLRRESLRSPHDLAFLHLHTGRGGAFDDRDRAMVATWAQDILEPWHRDTFSCQRLHASEQLELLVLLARCGGDASATIVRNLEQVERDVDGLPTRLTAALASFLAPDGTVDGERIRGHFDGFQWCYSRQKLPAGPVPAALVEALIETFEAHAAGVLAAIYLDDFGEHWTTLYGGGS